MPGAPNSVDLRACVGRPIAVTLGVPRSGSAGSFGAVFASVNRYVHLWADRRFSSALDRTSVCSLAAIRLNRPRNPDQKLMAPSKLILHAAQGNAPYDDVLASAIGAARFPKMGSSGFCVGGFWLRAAGGAR